MRSLTFAVALLAVAPAYACTDWGKTGRLLHADSFDKGMGKWVSEYNAGDAAFIGTRDGRLVIDVAGGATVWLKEKLAGNVLISYTRTVAMANGRNDRLSDLNQFWMASDPGQPNLFTRGGEFSEYDGLSLYYAGIGGNMNTTTRFRKYGNGERVLLQDLSDKAYLLVANHSYKVQVAVYKGCTRVLVDGKEFFNYRDPQPLVEGHFGFRTTQSRQVIDDFTVHRLE